MAEGGFDDIEMQGHDEYQNYGDEQLDDEHDRLNNEYRILIKRHLLK